MKHPDPVHLYPSYGALVLLLAGAAWLLVHPTALRDDSNAAVKPYSLARVQLWWWTVIILGCYILVYGYSDSFWPLNDTCALLLGISATTATAGRIIDNRDASAIGLSRHQDSSSQGFLNDIMSDEHGVSVHRFQTVAFNVAYGVHFVVVLVTDLFSATPTHQFPTFSEATLPLLGISSATYVAMKAGENRKPDSSDDARARAPGSMPGNGESTNDELIDPTPASPPAELH